MTCEQVQENLTLMVGPPDPSNPHVLEIRGHLDVCLGCRRNLAELEKVWYSLDQLQVTTSSPLPPPPPLIHQDLEMSRKLHQRGPFLLGLLLLMTVVMVGVMRIQRVDVDGVTLSLALAFMVLTGLSVWSGLKMGALSPRWGLGLLAGGLALFALSGVMGGQVEVPGFPEIQCLVAMVKLSLPGALLMVGALWGIKLPTPLSGALLGMGAGYVGATVLHLHCAVTTWTHILMFHGMGLVIMTALGALLAWGILRRSLKTH